MAQQLALYRELPDSRPAPSPTGEHHGHTRKLCAACREREARYGFQRVDEPQSARPRTLCFECFRVEVSRRQDIAARVAKGWNASQAGLPLSETLERLDLKRRRAQIAARHALDSQL